MIVYNVTVKVEHEINAAWVAWLKNEHADEVVNTGYFTGYKFFKVLVDDESDGITYSIQYSCESMSNYFDYLEKCAPAMREKGKALWGEKFVAFRTILREV
jgi:hypothetical protein